MTFIHFSHALVDTDVLSFLFNRDPVRALKYGNLLRGTTVHVSFASAAEMRFGALLRNWGVARQDRLEAFLAQYKIVESSEAIGRNWAKIRVESKRIGRTIERQDAWIAATAIHMNLPLVTHNAAHFQQLPLLQLVTLPDV